MKQERNLVNKKHNKSCSYYLFRFFVALSFAILHKMKNEFNFYGPGNSKTMKPLLRRTLVHHISAQKRRHLKLKQCNCNYTSPLNKKLLSFLSHVKVFPNTSARKINAAVRKSMVLKDIQRF